MLAQEDPKREQHTLHRAYVQADLNIPNLPNTGVITNVMELTHHTIAQKSPNWVYDIFSACIKVTMSHQEEL